jgi:hypothetical protein
LDVTPEAKIKNFKVERHTAKEASSKMKRQPKGIFAGVQYPYYVKSST